MAIRHLAVRVLALGRGAMSERRFAAEPGRAGVKTRSPMAIRHLAIRVLAPGGAPCPDAGLRTNPGGRV